MVLGGDAVKKAAFVQAMPDDAGVRLEQDIARAVYDLTMLGAAQELFLLDNRRPAIGLADIVPRYLPIALKDPFSGSDYQWSDTMSRFYSVGPDRKDDKLKALYSAGMSQGDGDLVVP